MKPPSDTFIKENLKENSINNISLSYSTNTFLQLLDLHRKEDNNSNRTNREGLAHETRATHPASFNA